MAAVAAAVPMPLLTDRNQLLKEKCSWLSENCRFLKRKIFQQLLGNGYRLTLLF